MKTPLARPLRAAIQVTALILLVSGPVHAAQNEGLSLEAYGYHLWDTEFDDGNAKYDLTRSGLKATYSHFRFVYDRLDYSWDDGEISKLPFGNGVDKPWKALQKLEIGANWEGNWNPKWSYSLDGAVFSAFEEDFGGYGGRVQAWAGYGLGQNLRLRFGARAYVYEFQLTALPVLSLDYAWDRKQGFSASIGVPEAYVRYAFNQYVALRLFGEYEQDLYRLADDSTVSREGYLMREGVMAGLMVDLTPVKGLCVSAGMIKPLSYTLTTYDKDGDNSKDYDQESGWGALVKVKYEF